MKKKESVNRIIGTVIYLEAILLLATVILSIHDTNTAVGAGYYLFLKSGKLSRQTWDILVDSLILIFICIAVLIPSACMKFRTREAALLFISNVALNSYIRPDRLVHAVFDRTEESYEVLSSDIRSFLITWLIILAVCLILTCFTEHSGEEKKNGNILLCLSVLFFGLSLFVSAASDILQWISGYVLLVFVVYLVAKHDERAQTVYTTVLFIRGMWRLFFVLSTYHL